MRLCVIVPNVPRLGLGGGGDRISGLIRQLAERRHEIHLVSVIGKHADREPSFEVLDGYSAIGVAIHSVRYVPAGSGAGGLRGLFRAFSDPEAVFTTGERATRPSVTTAVRAIAPDCVFSFSPDPLVYVQDLVDFPVLALMSETMHLNMRVRLAYGVPSIPITDPLGRLRRLKTRIEIAARERLDVQHCAMPTRLFFSAPHYLAWAKSRGIKDAALFRTSTPDAGKAVWRRKCEDTMNRAVTRILVIGHLHSTNNISGIPILFEEVLPALKRYMDQRPFEIRIVGAFDGIPLHLQKWLDSPDVTFHGAVSPADDEFGNADVVLVTVPARTGPRTRILTAFTFGCCVVAHTNNALGIPELKDGENCLLGRTGEEIASAVARAAADPDLRARLGAAGRHLYEQAYTHEIAGRTLERFLYEAIRIKTVGSTSPSGIPIT